jgi:hypothetical protein
MSRRTKRKCLHCGQWYMPDPRNLTRQKYCSEPACRKASKSASQRRWLRKPENRNYFRGTDNVQRAQEWRKAHPKNTGKNRVKEKPSPQLQDDCQVQLSENKTELVGFAPDTTPIQPLLQELSNAQHLVLFGLIAHLTGSLLQEDIARSSRSFIQLGQDILSTNLSTQGGRHHGTANPSPGPSSPRASPF